jgi:hypothetical protein
MSVSKTSDNSANIQKAVAALLRQHVVIGIPDSTAERQPEPGDTGTPPSNAVIGYAMEFGLPDKNVPARPFLFPGCEVAQPVVTERLAKAGLAALSGSADAVERGLIAAGLAAENAVRAKITDGPFAPLSQRTIEARAARGQKGAKDYLKLQGQGTPDDILQSAGLTKPLIDSGQLRRAVTSVVRSK